jgi:hypothetical protein
VWHVLRAMQKKLWQMLHTRSQEDFKSIMKQIHSIMHIELHGSLEQKRSVVNARVQDLLTAWRQSSNRNYNEAGKYFQYWAAKTGLQPLILMIIAQLLFKLRTRGSACLWRLTSPF